MKSIVIILFCKSRRPYKEKRVSCSSTLTSPTSLLSKQELLDKVLDFFFRVISSSLTLQLPCCPCGRWSRVSWLDSARNRRFTKGNSSTISWLKSSATHRTAHVTTRIPSYRTKVRSAMFVPSPPICVTVNIIRYKTIWCKWSNHHTF